MDYVILAVILIGTGWVIWHFGAEKLKGYMTDVPVEPEDDAKSWKNDKR